MASKICLVFLIAAIAQINASPFFGKKDNKEDKPSFGFLNPIKSVVDGGLSSIGDVKDKLSVDGIKNAAQETIEKVNLDKALNAIEEVKENLNTDKIETIIEEAKEKLNAGDIEALIEGVDEKVKAGDVESLVAETVNNVLNIGEDVSEKVKAGDIESLVKGVVDDVVSINEDAKEQLNADKITNIVESAKEKLENVKEKIASQVETNLGLPLEPEDVIQDWTGVKPDIPKISIWQPSKLFGWIASFFTKLPLGVGSAVGKVTGAVENKIESAQNVWAKEVAGASSNMAGLIRSNE